MSFYDPNALKSWWLDKQLHKDRARIDAADDAVVDRESEKACYLQWRDAAGTVIHEGWVPKYAIELRGELPRVDGEHPVKTELREWMWEHDLPSDGTETLQELKNAVMWGRAWSALPDVLKRLQDDAQRKRGESPTHNCRFKGPGTPMTSVVRGSTHGWECQWCGRYESNSRRVA